jgi:adenine-specific DNA-methyltransferase
MANRLLPQKNDVRFVRHAPMPPIREISNWWDGFGGAANPVYVVQTNERVLERVLLLSTDPGDLVLDITCGSGTTPVAAEKWGRRWIAIDTSRVALALARSRVMSQVFPYFILCDSREGYSKTTSALAQAPLPTAFGHKLNLGFACERAFNVTSGSIANNSEIEIIWSKWQERLDPLRAKLNLISNKVPHALDAAPSGT